MVDDFRQIADTTPLFEEEPPLEPPRKSNLRYASQERFLGLTPPQRFVIAAMLLVITCLLASFCLLVTEKIVPPL